MISVKLICVGKMREQYYTAAFAEYQKRLRTYCRFEAVEIAEHKLPETPSTAEIAAAHEREGEEILHAIPVDSCVVALCVEGEQMPSEGMAEFIRQRAGSGKPKLCFIIGGSYGLSGKVKARADHRLSMSRMTFPHHLARVMLIEQLYRGFKILEGSRYHK